MLSYGPASMTTLSPPTATTRTGIGSRLASLIVHPLPSAVAVSTDVTTTLSFGPSTVLLSHVPATSASLMPPFFAGAGFWAMRSEEHTSELQSRLHLVCRLLLEKKK